MNSAAISGIKVNGNHDDYTIISNPAVDKPVDVTPIPQGKYYTTMYMYVWSVLQNIIIYMKLIAPEIKTFIAVLYNELFTNIAFGSRGLCTFMSD